jgi:hypothetical protein
LRPHFWKKEYERGVKVEVFFTKAAENSNAENLLIIHDNKLASLYTKN